MDHDFEFAAILKEACRDPDIRQVPKRIWKGRPTTRAEVRTKTGVLHPGGDEPSAA
jgi:hypothetical protein